MKEIVSLLHLLHYDYFLFVTLKLLVSIRDFGSLRNRLEALSPICDLLIENHITYFNPRDEAQEEQYENLLYRFFASDWIKNLWKG
jgi:hypothetical protein